MKFSGIPAVFGILAAVTSAAPAEKKHFSVEVTFIGAADASFTQWFIADGSEIAISMCPRSCCSCNSPASNTFQIVMR